MSNEVSYTNELQPSESPYPSHSLNLHPDPVYGGNEDSFENLIQTSQEEDSSSLRGWFAEHQIEGTKPSVEDERSRRSPNHRNQESYQEVAYFQETLKPTNDTSTTDKSYTNSCKKKMQLKTPTGLAINLNPRDLSDVNINAYRKCNHTEEEHSQELSIHNSVQRQKEGENQPNYKSTYVQNSTDFPHILNKEPQIRTTDYAEYEKDILGQKEKEKRKRKGKEDPISSPSQDSGEDSTEVLIENTDEEISDRDEEMSGRDEERSGRDEELSENDEEVSGRDEELNENDEEMNGRDEELNENDEELSENDKE
ncbi:WD repeat-containing protein 87, partial [Planoprotostelium fungivorum]